MVSRHFRNQRGSGIDQNGGQPGFLEAHCVVDCILQDRQHEGLGLVRAGAGGNCNQPSIGGGQVVDGARLVGVGVWTTGALLHDARQLRFNGQIGPALTGAERAMRLQERLLGQEDRPGELPFTPPLTPGP